MPPPTKPNQTTKPLINQFVAVWKKLISRRTALLVGAAALLALAAYGGWRQFYHKKYYQPAKITVVSAKSYPYSYTKLDSYQLKGPAAGTGAFFQKPVELTPLGAPGADQVQLVQFAGPHNQTPYLSQVAIVSVASSPSVLANLDQTFSTFLLDNKNLGYSGAVKPISTFIDQRQLSNYAGTVIGNFTQFANTNIKSSAWVADFSDESKDPAKDLAGQKNALAGKTIKKQPSLSGRVVVVLGKSNFYYFFVDSLTENWQTNQNVWQQVVGSLKIDQ